MKRKQDGVKPEKGAAAVESSDHADQVTIRPLGAGQEVGRSCFLLRYQGKGVMFDCGIHPAYTGMSSLPMMDNQSLEEIDVALITHFHLDHCAALPCLVGNTNFNGSIFMTHATKNIFYTMMKDMLRMHKKDPSRYLFSAEDLEATMSRISSINFHQTVTVDGIQITPYRAGHVLGAAMFMVEIRGMRCLYTGDYSRIPDRHMPAADLPGVPPHIVIVESTFGTSNHLPREDREKAFQNKVREVIAGGGRCLIPVVALGRAQELLLILEDCWARHSDLRQVPIYQTSGIATQSLGVYQSYIEMMNDNMRAVFTQRNPFEFKFVKHTRGFRADSEIGPCVVLATPSMLQTGLSRELFEAWCEDSRNGIIIADFAVQGTLARELLSSPKEVLASDGRMLKVRCAVSSFSFSAHADYNQTSHFVSHLAPAHVVLCHGNTNEMERLKKGLEKQAREAGAAREIHAPANLSDVCIPFIPRRMVHVVGEAAENPPKVGDKVQGITVQRKAAEAMRVMTPDDLGVYNKVSVGQIIQRQHMALSTNFSKCRLALEVMFEGIDAEQAMGGIEGSCSEDEGHEVLMVAGLVKVTHIPVNGARTQGGEDGPYGRVVLEWHSGPLSDCVADSVISILLQEQGQPAAIGAAEQQREKAIAEGDQDAARAADKFIAVELLRTQFGKAEVEEESGEIIVSIPSNRVVVDWDMDNVTTEPEDAALKGRVLQCLSRLRVALRRLDPQENESSAQDTATVAGAAAVAAGTSASATGAVMGAE